MYARDNEGIYVKKSDPAFWDAAEQALVATVQLEARSFGAMLTDQQVKNAATRCCWTRPCRPCLLFCVHLPHQHSPQASCSVP